MNIAQIAADLPKGLWVKPDGSFKRKARRAFAAWDVLRFRRLVKEREGELRDARERLAAAEEYLAGFD